MKLFIYNIRNFFVSGGRGIELYFLSNYFDSVIFAIAFVLIVFIYECVSTRVFLRIVYKRALRRMNFSPNELFRTIRKNKKFRKRLVITELGRMV